MRRIFRRDFIGGVFRAMRRKVVLEVRRCREHERLLVGLIDWTGFRQTGYEVEHAERFAGSTSYSLSAQLQLAIVSVTAFSTLPLRLATWTGFLISGCAFLGALFLVGRHVVFDQGVEGWTSTLVVVSILGGLQLLALGVLGEYVGRVYTATRRRPLYVIDEDPRPIPRSPSPSDTSGEH
jgi:dolichol-phosphate mannosyltransferase